MKQLCKEAFEFAMKKATTDQQKDQIIKNFKEVYKLIYKLEKQDGKHVSSTRKECVKRC